MLQSEDTASVSQLNTILDHAKQGRWGDALSEEHVPSLSSDLINKRPEGREFTLLHHAVWFADFKAMEKILCVANSVIDIAVKTSKGESIFDVAKRHDETTQKALRITIHTFLAQRNEDRLRIMSFNAYLIPGWLVNDDNKTCVRQGERAVKAGKTVVSERVDVLLFQEMWGSSVAGFQQEIESNMNVHPQTQKSFGFTLLDSVSYFMRQTGGLYAGSKSIYPLLHFSQEKFEFSNTKSQKGIAFVLLDVSVAFPTAPYLLCCNTHLDPTNENNSQRKQLKQLHEAVARNARSLSAKFGFSLAQCGIFLTGDFNIDSNYSHELYKTILNAGHQGGRDDLTICDIHKENSGFFDSKLVTYCSAQNSLATWGVGERLDYILYVEAIGDDKTASLEVHTCSIPKYPNGEETSDHYPIIAEVTLSERK